MSSVREKILNKEVRKIFKNCTRAIENDNTKDEPLYILVTQAADLADNIFILENEKNAAYYKEKNGKKVFELEEIFDRLKISASSILAKRNYIKLSKQNMSSVDGQEDVYKIKIEIEVLTNSKYVTMEAVSFEAFPSKFLGREIEYRDDGIWRGKIRNLDINLGSWGHGNPKVAKMVLESVNKDLEATKKIEKTVDRAREAGQRRRGAGA